MKFSEQNLKKIFITGSSGMLAKAIIQVLSESENNQIYGLDKVANPNFTGFKEIILDITDKVELNAILSSIDPDVIIHAAAIVSLQTCESNKELADAIHVEATKNLALKSNELGSRLLYISTDSVFDGTEGGYKEDSSVNPLNYYASSKFMGEQAAAMSKDYLIIRTNIYGLNHPMKGSIAEWAIKSWEQGEVISGYTDVYFNAVYIKQLGQVIKKLINMSMDINILNVGQKEVLSKYEFLKILNQTLDFDKSLLKSDKSNDYGAIKRPKNTSLDLSLLESYMEIPSTIVGMAMLKEDYNKILNDE